MGEVTDQVTIATIATTPKNTAPTTFQSISGFAPPSLIHNNQTLLYVSYSETSATALCGIYAALLVFIGVYCPICFLRPVEIIAASLCSNSWDCGRCSFPALVCSWRWMHGFQNVEGRSRSASRWVKPASCLFLGAWYTLSKTQTCSMRENTTTTTSSPTADIFEQTDRPCICNYVCFMFFRHRHRLIL